MTARPVGKSSDRSHIGLQSSQLPAERRSRSSQETILVTGAAGSVGSTAHTAIATLLEQGHRVRAMVRKLDARADTLRDMGAEVVVADMLDIIAVRAAMQGCSVVYFTMSISPNYLEAAANVAVTAKSLGVKAFVNLSQMTVSEMSETETTSSPQQKQEWLAEQMLRWSGLPVVYLRPTAFFDGMFLVQGAKGIRDDNVIRLPFADGKTALIAGADVGVAAAAVLANPEPHIGKVYELTGPQSLTMARVRAGVQPRSGPHHPIRQRAATNLGSQAPRGSTAGASDRTPDHHGPAESRQPLRPHDRLLPAVGRPSADFRRRIRTPPRGRVHAWRILPFTNRRCCRVTLGHGDVGVTESDFQQTSASNRRRERQARVLLAPGRGVSGSRGFPSDSY